VTKSVQKLDYIFDIPVTAAAYASRLPALALPLTGVNAFAQSRAILL
jgi:hypothetical protein